MSALAAALDGCLSVDARAMGPALADHIEELVTARHRLDAAIERAVGVYDAAGYCELDGAKTTASWLRGRTRMAPSEASARVKTARYLRELPETAAALARGEISFDHARAFAMLAADTDVETTRSVEAQLVELARLIDPVRLGRELRVIRESWQPEPKPDPDETAWQRRSFSCVESLDGSFSLGGWLTGEGGATLRAALEPLAKPLPGDTRSPAQRTADALVEMARRQCSSGDLPTSHGVQPHLIVVADLEDDSTESAEESTEDTTSDDVSHDATDHAAAADDTDDGSAAAGEAEPASGPTPQPSGPTGGSLRLVRGRIIGGGALSRRALERYACNSTVSRLLIRPSGEILDLGRSQRVVTPAQWKTLVLRDNGCVIPGHDCPPVATEAHHLIPWLRGGLTNIDNLALVCTFGHHLIHDDGWCLYLRPSDRRWILRRPDGTEIEGQIIGQTGVGQRGITDAIAHGPRGPCDRAVA